MPRADSPLSSENGNQPERAAATSTFPGPNAQTYAVPRAWDTAGTAPDTIISAAELGQRAQSAAQEMQQSIGQGMSELPDQSGIWRPDTGNGGNQGACAFESAMDILNLGQSESFLGSDFWNLEFGAGGLS